MKLFVLFQFRQMSSTPTALSLSFVDSTDDLVRRFETPLPNQEPFNTSCPSIHESGQALLVVKLQTLWSDFCHNLIAIYASSKNASIKKAASHVTHSMGLSNPVWHSPEFVVRVANHLTLNNVDSIELHIGASISSGSVTKVRNYIVHPGHRSEVRFKEVTAAEGVPSVGVGELLNIRFPGGASMFERWVKDLQRTARDTTAR